jgi:hypothetical protein
MIIINARAVLLFIIDQVPQNFAIVVYRTFGSSTNMTVAWLIASPPWIITRSEFLHGFHFMIPLCFVTVL